MKALQPNINSEDKELMEKLLAAGHIEYKYAARLQTVLLRAKGKGDGEISDFLGIHEAAVSSYINRYHACGIDALLHGKARKPGKEPISQGIKNEIYRLACNVKPAGETHWSCRALAKRAGIGHAPVNTILREYGLKPHLASKKNYGTGPLFEEKLKDAAGLYLGPPENAVVLCVDGKTQMQALERSQPVLPIIRNVPERQAVDCLRHGTATLFAALGVLNGKVIGGCTGAHSSEDFIRFLKKIDKACGKKKVLHIAAGNLSAHKTKGVNEYFESIPGRFALYFIPAHSSWLNLAERRFAEITDKQIRRGSYESAAQLTESIKDFIKSWNKPGRAFKWAKEPEEILAKIKKAKSF
jgi:transposase